MHELRRRGIWRVAIGYLAASWLHIQILETVLPVFDLPETSIRRVIIVLAVGMLPALAPAWVFERTPEGLRREAEVDHGAADLLAASRFLDRLVIFTPGPGCYLFLDRQVFWAAPSPTA
ncbi:MAG: hypothetical protein ACK2U9_06470 [Anaerolineae bacterium]